MTWLNIAECTVPHTVTTLNDDLLHPPEEFTLFYRRARAGPAWSGPGTARLGRPGRLGAGRGPPQLGLVNCILSQFEFGASDGVGPWREEGLVIV